MYTRVFTQRKYINEKETNGLWLLLDNVDCEYIEHTVLDMDTNISAPAWNHFSGYSWCQRYCFLFLFFSVSIKTSMHIAVITSKISILLRKQVMGNKPTTSTLEALFCWQILQYDHNRWICFNSINLRHTTSVWTLSISVNIKRIDIFYNHLKQWLQHSNLKTKSTSFLNLHHFFCKFS